MLFCFLGKGSRTWSEEVELGDGSLIVVLRDVKFTSSNSWAGDAYSATTIRSTLSFRDDLASLPIWNFPLEPLLLYRDEVAKEWVIVVTTNSCDTWADWGSPSSPYWEFRLRHGKWLRTELSRASIGRKTNLFFNYEPGVPAGNLTRELKAQSIRGIAFAKEYRSIDASMTSTARRRFYRHRAAWRQTA